MARPTHRCPTPMPLFSRLFGVGGGCCVLAPLLTRLSAISSSLFTFRWSFLRLALVRPGLRRFSGRPLRPSGRKPGGLDGRNGSPILPGAFLSAGNRFPPDDFVWRRLPSPLFLLHDFSLIGVDQAKIMQQFKVLQRPLRVLRDARRCSLQEEAVRVEWPTSPRNRFSKR